MSSRILADIITPAFYCGNRVRGTGADAAKLHARDIRKIIADICCLRGIDMTLFQNTEEDAFFILRALIKFRNIQLLRSGFNDF